jgi:hypothetical protein
MFSQFRLADCDEQAREDEDGDCCAGPVCPSWPLLHRFPADMRRHLPDTSLWDSSIPVFHTHALDSHKMLLVVIGEGSFLIEALLDAQQIFLDGSLVVAESGKLLLLNKPKPVSERVVDATSLPCAGSQ